MIEKGFKYLQYFSYKELENHYTGKGFSIEDSKKEIKKISEWYMMKMDLLRSLIGDPIHFNSLTDGTHVQNSYHYKGEAGDWRTTSKKTPNQILQHCIEADFKRIGWYPEWNTPGFHTDTGHGTALWTRKKKVYLPLLEG